MFRLESCDECIAQKNSNTALANSCPLGIHDSRFNEPFDTLVGLRLPRRRPLQSGVNMACLVIAIPFQTNLSLIRFIHWAVY